MEYAIEIDDNNDFYLFIDGVLSSQGSKPWILDHLMSIAIWHCIEIPKTFTSESEIYYYLKDQHGLSIDVGDWCH